MVASNHFTIPVDKIRPEIWEKQKTFADKVLPPSFAQLVHQIKKPFITAVSDAACPRATLFDRRVLFVGDALSLGRQNVGMSTNRAGFSAIQLGKVLNDDISWDVWERDVLNDGYSTALRAIAVANMFLAGKFKWITSELHYRLSLYTAPTSQI